MSLGSIGVAVIGTTIVKIKYDTSEARGELSKLTGAEKAAQEALIKSEQARTNSMEKWKIGFMQLNAAMQVAQTGIGYLSDAWKAYEKSAYSAGGAEAERAKKFRSALDAWSVALDNATIAVGRAVAEQAELVHSLAKVASGIQSVTAAANNLFGSVPGGTYIKWIKDHAPSNPVSYAKNTLGWLTDRGDDVANALGDADLVPTGQQGFDDFNGVASGNVGGANDYNEGLDQWKRDHPDWQQVLAGKARNDARRLKHAYKLAQAAARKASGGGGGGYEMAGEDLQDDPMRFAAATYGPGAPLVPKGYAQLDTSYSDVNDQTQNSFGAGSSWKPEDLTDMIAKAKENLSFFEQQSVLERILGPIEEFDVYGKAFATLTGAVGAAYDAMVSGQMGAGAAFKAFVKESLMAHGKEAAVRSVTELGYAFASLGWHDYPAAASHFQSAALFGAGALAAGVASHALAGGGGGGAGGGGGGVGASVIGSSGSSQAPGTTTNVFVGDGFSNDNHWRQQRTARDLALANRESGGNSEVVRW